jgi:hypothetical protein
MAIITRSTAHANASHGANTDFTITRGAVVEKDIMIAWFALNGTGSSSVVPNGWTLGTSVTNGGIGFAGWWWKLAGASEASSYAWQWNAFQDGAFGMWIGSGNDPVNPIAGNSTQSDAAANTGTPITAGSASWSGAKDVVSVILIGIQPVVTVTPPSGWNDSTDGWTDSDGTDSGFHYGNLTTVAAATSLPSKTFSVSGTTGADAVQIAIALAPAVGGVYSGFGPSLMRPPRVPGGLFRPQPAALPPAIQPAGVLWPLRRALDAVRRASSNPR